LICGALSYPYLRTHIAVVLAHSKRATAQRSLVVFLFEAGETVREIFYLANAIDAYFRSLVA